jgi:carbamoyl-phosphate synthase small subunit
MNKKAYLILADGTVFEGESFGADGDVMGEVVFTTAMTGYLETLTDPNYSGQIVTQTFPLIGNYGVNDEDKSSDKTHVRGYIVREWCEIPSNFRCEGTIDEHLKKHGVVGLCGIDTRKLTRILRDKGTMNGMISATQDIDLNEIKSFKPALEFPNNPPAEFKSDNAKYNIALLDLGYKFSLRDALLKYGCSVTVLPWNADCSGFDGVVISDGAGDPAEMTMQISAVKTLLDKKIPLYGVGLGHLLLALALGGKTAKLAQGHRGANQPVIDLESGRTYLTSQNHGYVVETPPETGKITHINNNDRTCEGLSYGGLPAFGTQFAPETSGSTNDMGFLYERFVGLMK